MFIPGQEEQQPQWNYDNSAQVQAGQERDQVLSNAWDSFTNGIQSWWSGSRLNPKNWFNHMITGDNIFQSNNSASTQGKIAYTKTGIPYDESNIDSQINALAQEYAYKRDDQSYDRLIAALKRNGMNPALVLGNSASPMSSDTAYRSNYNMTTKDQVNSALTVGSILAIVMSALIRKG